MDALWDAPQPVTAGELQDLLAARTHSPLALTTVMTMLARLEKKGFVTRDRGTRPHLYRPVSSRSDHVAELMHQVLGTSADRDAVLTRFVGQVTPDEAAILRRLLDQG